MNTNFYHRSTVIRRNRGRIQMLKIEGEWTTDPTILANHVTEHFNRLFHRVNRDNQVAEVPWEGRKIDG